MEQFLLNHAVQGAVSFHMPGHKGSDIYKECGHGEFLDRIMDCDITEIPGADNLFQAEGIIKDLQQRYAALYDVERSYALINSTSGGLIAAILAIVPQGGRLVMARNSHKAIFNALTLGSIEPVYAQPKMIDEYGISGEITAEEIERCLKSAPEAAAVVLASPNYYGICSDIEAIAEVCHRMDKVLIVDQAHGAHLQFFHKFGCGDGLPLPAERCGADITVNSIHKTLASFTQSAVLNLNSDLVDRYLLEDKLQAIQSSSPSYLLMASLDINADIIESQGKRIFRHWRKWLDDFYEEAGALDGIKLLTAGGMDRTKINIDAGQPGSELLYHLMMKDIIPELVTGNIVMCMSGIGNTRADYRRLLRALKKFRPGDEHPENLQIPRPGRLHGMPEEWEYVPLQEAAGRIAAASLIPYPPGIPIVCPGEEITAEMAAYIGDLRGRKYKVVGLNDEGQVRVGRESG
ncbi:MAG: aminotransferase class I/II-fold pyridoxal phosphate-dependent enzyme [Anaerovoracaceae bacterium]|jgi:arginine/lysine/ornithine decarboxylase